MATRNNNPKFREQWSKFMTYFFDYVPVKYKATQREWDVRHLIWEFKDGKRSEQVAEIVSRMLQKQFGDEAGEIVFCCIPASSEEKNEQRYKDFSAQVCRLTGTIDGYDHVNIGGSRLAIHEKHGCKTVENVQVINFDETFFSGKKVLIFDDILTKGISYARFACMLESFGASVLGGYFLGRTVLK